MPPADKASSPRSLALPPIEDLSGAAMIFHREDSTQSPPALRVGYPDQRAVIAQVMEMISRAEPVPEPATRYADHSPVFTLYLAKGGGASIVLAYQCAIAPESPTPADCRRVESQVTFFPPNDAKPMRLRSPELVAWLEGGWAHNWPIADPPKQVAIKMEVRGATPRRCPHSAVRK